MTDHHSGLTGRNCRVSGTNTRGYLFGSARGTEEGLKVTDTLISTNFLGPRLRVGRQALGLDMLWLHGGDTGTAYDTNTGLSLKARLRNLMK